MSLNRLGWAVAAGFVLLPLSAAVMAQAEYAGWAVTPGVSISQIYSDNIGLAPRGEEDDEFVTELDLGVALRREGSRTRARLDYSLRGLAYWSDSDSNDVFHQLDADSVTNLVPERLFLEASANYDQRVRSRSGRTGDLVNTGVDRTDVFRFRISPLYVHRFEDVAAAELRYSHDRVYYEESDARDIDSERNRVRATLDSGPMFSRVGWGLSFERSEEDFDDGSSVTFQSAEALGRLNFTERLSIFGAVGDEQNSFEQDPSRARPDDTFWRAGATFRPTARTFTEAYVGERFFGTTYGATVRRDLRDGRLFADYTEELRTTNDIDVTPIRDADGQLIFDPETGRPIFELPDLFSGVFLRKRFSAGVSIRRPKTNWGVRVYDERREFQTIDQNERVQGVIGDISWRVLPRTEVFANARFEESTFVDERDREDTLFTTRLGVSRNLGPQTSASLDYLYRERGSTDDAREYRENRLTATFTKIF